jgi:hypothetical protein
MNEMFSFFDTFLKKLKLFRQFEFSRKSLSMKALFLLKINNKKKEKLTNNQF